MISHRRREKGSVLLRRPATLANFMTYRVVLPTLRDHGKDIDGFVLLAVVEYDT